MIPPTLAETCLSDFALDRHLGDELDGQDESFARAHVASCARCARRLDARRLERDAFAKEASTLEMVTPRGDARQAHARSTTRLRHALLAAGIPLAAAAAVVMLWLRGPERYGARLKGSDWRLGFYVSHAGVVREGASGERVEPGDALRFTYAAPDARYVAVLSVDGAKRASTYYPASGAVSRAEPGRKVALPQSTVLDDVLGDERIYGVGCRRPFDVEALREALDRAPDQPPALPDCRVDALLLHKEAPLRR